MRSMMVAATAASLCLSACATTYHGFGATGGYRDRQTASGRWEVSFLGNDFVRRGFKLNGALYRAAELANRAGFSHFQVVQSSLTIGDFAVGEGYGSDGPEGPTVYLTIVGVRMADAPIQCENNYERGCRTFATAEVLSQLGPIVRR